MGAPLYRAGEIDDVSRVEDLRVVVVQHAVVRAQSERPQGIAVALAVVSLVIANAEHLAERIVGHEGDAAGLLLPSSNQAIVIGIAAVTDQGHTRVEGVRIVVGGWERGGIRIVDDAGLRICLEERAIRYQIDV